MSTTVNTDTEARLSYVALLEPRAADDKQPDVLTFSASVLIPKEDTATIEAIKDAIKAALAEGKAKGVIKSTKDLRNPLRDGDEKEDKNGNPDQVYAGHMFLNAKGPKGGKEAPILFDKSFEVTEDAKIIYSGVYARVGLQFYAYNTKGNVGIACGLTTVVSGEHGEPLDNTLTVDGARAAFGAPASASTKAKAEFEGTKSDDAEPDAEADEDDIWGS